MKVYLATATAGGAVLITGNSRDFTESRYGSVEVFSRAPFWIVRHEHLTRNYDEDKHLLLDGAWRWVAVRPPDDG